MWSEGISCRYIFSNNADTLARPIYPCHLWRIYSPLDFVAIVTSKWSNSLNRRANNRELRIFQQMVPADSHTSRWHLSLDNPICIRFACRSCIWWTESKLFHFEVFSGMKTLTGPKGFHPGSNNRANVDYMVACPVNHSQPMHPPIRKALRPAAVFALEHRRLTRPNTQSNQPDTSSFR